MSILSGWLKTRAYRKTADGYKKESRDTSSETVYMNDGNTAETNLGDIKGITDSLTATSSNVALSAKGGNSLQGQIDTLNSNLNNKVNTTDSRLSNARPASDVYSWAKASSKPSYSWNEVGAAASNHTHDDRYYTETEINNILEYNIYNFSSILNTNFIRGSSDCAVRRWGKICHLSGLLKLQNLVSGSFNTIGVLPEKYFPAYMTRNTCDNMSANWTNPGYVGANNGVLLSIDTNGTLFISSIESSVDVWVDCVYFCKN